MAEMVVNTYDLDRADYALAQTQFYQAQAFFRAGNVAAGYGAVGHLRAMYRLLWYRKHQQRNKTGSDKFIDLLKTTEDAITHYAKNHKNDQPAESIFKTGFRELITTFDLAAERYQQIIIECEAKP
jgi:hypothetical protein